MSSQFDFDEVDAFTVGAVGRPGERTFYLQARRGGARITVKCEKQQAAAIAEHLRRILHDLPAPTEKPLAAAMELVAPVEPVFVLGTIGLGYDRTTDRLLLQLEEIEPFDPDAELDDELDELDDELDGGDDELSGADFADLDGLDALEAEFEGLDTSSAFDALDDLDDDRGVVRVFITRDQAHEFCAHTDSVVAAGRPQCMWCNRPADPDGHACARMN